MCNIHPRHAALLDMVDDYLAAKGKSARWLGLTVAQDARMVPNLQRGQTYPARVMLALLERLIGHLMAQQRQDETDADALGEQLGRSGGHQLRAFPRAE